MKTHGFTLVEILVSLFILAVALVGAIGLLAYNLKSSRVIKNNFVAGLLAQEGIEVVRAMRDTDWFKEQAFGTTVSAGTYRVEWDSSSLIALGSNPALLFNSSTGLYQYATGATTPFTRTVIVTNIGTAEKRVVVSVSWSEGGGSKNVSAETHLYDWF